MPNIYLIFKHSSIYLFAQSKFKQIYNEDEVTFLPFSNSFPLNRPLASTLSDIWQGISIAIRRKIFNFLAKAVRAIEKRKTRENQNQINLVGVAVVEKEEGGQSASGNVDTRWQLQSQSQPQTQPQF